jgi:hypothetical protein
VRGIDGGRRGARGCLVGGSAGGTPSAKSSSGETGSRLAGRDSGPSGTIVGPEGVNRGRGGGTSIGFDTGGKTGAVDGTGFTPLGALGLPGVPGTSVGSGFVGVAGTLGGGVGRECGIGVGRRGAMG